MIEVVFNNLSKPDGSALVEQNNTIVQAAVFGPVEVSQAKINYEEAFIEMIFKPKVSIPSSSREFEIIREYEFILKSIFKSVILMRQHPRTMISIIVQEIYNAGSLLSVAINAICCALLDSGLPLKTPIAALTIVSRSKSKEVADEASEEFVVLPSREVEESCSTKYHVVFDNQHNVETLRTEGKFTTHNLKKAIELGRTEAKTILEDYRTKIRERFTIA